MMEYLKNKIKTFLREMQGFFAIQFVLERVTLKRLSSL